MTITNKILSSRTIVVTDIYYKIYQLLLNNIHEINKKVKIIYFKNPMNAFNFITSNKVHMVISNTFSTTQLYGINFLIAFKSLYPQVPFIQYTAYSPSSMPHTKKADAFFLLPLLKEDLFAAINNLIDDNKSTEKINQKIKIKDIDTMALLDKANDMLRKITILVNEYEE